MFIYSQKLKTFSLTTFLLFLSFLIFINNTQAADDMIGIRVYSNINHLSPSEWYFNTVQYAGSPQLIQVDGYEAVLDGGTAYVAATNDDGGVYYTNIYLLTYNQQAVPETINIFNQLIDNWYFNTNIDETTDEKGQITRDTKRLADLQTTASLLLAYGEEHKYCSVSGAKCQDDSDCASSQTCDPHYPEISSGSFVQGQTTSRWPSWQQTLALTLNAPNLQSDPTNEFFGCVNPTNPDYDPNTCWNETINEFSCLTGSKFYFYNTTDPSSYELATKAEIFNSNNLDNRPTLDNHLNIEGLINNSPMCTAGGLGTFCGDSILNSPPEECEVGYTRNYCDITCGDQDWHLDVVTGCNNDCTWYDPFGVTSCAQIGSPEIWTGYCGGYCGDNELQAIWEECDTNQMPSGWSCIGSATLDCDNNCELTCSDGSPPYNGDCGNTIIEYPETCENPYTPPDPAQSSQSLQYECINCAGGGGWCGDNICQLLYEDIVSCPVDCSPNPPGYFNITQNQTDPMGTLDLEWENVFGEDGYKLWRSTQSGVFLNAPIFISGTDITTYSDLGLASNIHYYYQIVSYSGVGESSYVYTDESTASGGTIFTSSNLNLYSGNLLSEAQVLYGYNANDPLEAADYICQSLVNSPVSKVKSGVWRAWLSNSTITGDNMAGTRIVDIGEDYKLPNLLGAVVANNLTDLKDGSLNYAINRDENGSANLYNGVWTASNIDGSYSYLDENCNGWSTNSISYSGQFGVYSQTNVYWTNWPNPYNQCSDVNHLYCLYQGTTNHWPDPPTNLTTNPGLSSVELNWSDNSGNETGFEIFRSLDGINWGTGPYSTVSAGSVQYIDNSVTPGTTYYYKVRAERDDAGIIYYSYFSNVVNFTAITGGGGTIFLSSSSSTGNLYGPYGADAICNGLAMNSSYVKQGQWRAWISDYHSNAVDRFQHTGQARIIDLTLPDGRDIGDFTVPANVGSPGLMNLTDDNINITDQLQTLNSEAVWTGSYADGTHDNPSCVYWSSNDWGDDGTVGHTGGGSWTYWNDAPCGSSDIRVYCIFDHEVDNSPGTVFVSSIDYSGDLNGTAGADQICTDLAGNSPHVKQGQWRAWISDNYSQSIDRFNQPNNTTKNLVRPDGIYIGTLSNPGGADLVFQNNDAQINIDENLNYKGDNVWTNTYASGQVHNGVEHCQSWNTQDNFYEGWHGSSSDWTQWSVANKLFCDFTLPIFCFYDDPNPDTPRGSGTIFVSSQSYTGDLGGIEGADQKCTDLANASPNVVYGQWRAILSTDTDDIADRLTLWPNNQYDWILSDGTDIGYMSAGWYQLDDNLNMDENQAPVTSGKVWSNTADLLFTHIDNNDCYDWTLISGSGNYGNINAGGFGSTWLNSGSTDSCSQSNRLYCILDQPWAP